MCILRSSRKFDPLRSCFERASARYGDGCFVHVRQNIESWPPGHCRLASVFRIDQLSIAIAVLTAWFVVVRLWLDLSMLQCFGLYHEYLQERARERPLYPANRQYSQAILLRVAREWAITSSHECLRSSSSWPSSVCVWWWKPLTRCSQKRQEMLVFALL